MALTRAWSEALPTDDNYGYEIDDYMRQSRTDVRERAAVQHKAYADETGHTDVGEHKPGECTIVKIGAKSTFPTPATTTAGCLAIATDEGNQAYYWSGTAWVKCQEPVLITGNQTIAGAKTFSGAVVLNAISTVKDGSIMSTSGAPTTDAMIANKKYVDDQIAALQRRIVQVVNTQSGSLGTGTTIMPRDDSIPQISEGDEYMTLAITPTSATNKLKIEVVWNGCSSVGSTDITVALFKGTDADALACASDVSYGQNDSMQIAFTHYMTAGTTDAITFRVRAGMKAAGTTTFNGEATGRLYGGVMASSITITEIRV